MARLTSPSAIPTPLSEHALSHVMSEILDNFAPTDEDEIRNSLIDAGYRPPEVRQVMAAWSTYWEKQPACSTCGQPATHLWGSIDENGVLGSMAGHWKLSPSCDSCAGGPYSDGAGCPVVRAPLSYGRELLPVGEIPWAALVEVVVNSDPEQAVELGRMLAQADAQVAHEWLSALLDGFARVAADESHLVDGVRSAVIFQIAVGAEVR